MATHRVVETVRQQRAHASYSIDGDANTERDVKTVVTTTSPLPEWRGRMLRDFSAFIEHAFIAREQADTFDKQIDELVPGVLLILADYSMNYGHEHQDAEQQEWWSAWQSTLLPVIVYYKDEHGVVWAESFCFLSEDLNHSNGFWQHAAEKILDHYTGKMQAMGTPLTDILVWSDGCAGQFKQKGEGYWLIRLALKRGLRATHSFFASCHGKGPGDSEGAVVKVALRRAELMLVYFSQTIDAFEYLCEKLTIAKRPCEAVHKERHTIGARTFVHIAAGEVDHHKYTVANITPGTQTMHAMRNNHGALGDPHLLVYGALTCPCVGCIKFDLAKPCINADNPQYKREETLMQLASNEDARRTARSSTKFLEERALELISSSAGGSSSKSNAVEIGSDVFLFYSSEPPLCLAKVITKPVKEPGTARSERTSVWRESEAGENVGESHVGGKRKVIDVVWYENTDQFDQFTMARDWCKEHGEGTHISDCTLACSQKCMHRDVVPLSSLRGAARADEISRRAPSRGASVAAAALTADGHRRYQTSRLLYQQAFSRVKEDIQSRVEVHASGTS